MNKRQEKECRLAFEEWNGGPVSFKTYELYQGWKACYTWILAGKKKEFDIMLDEMYNDYKQENLDKK